jgi:hypothetical protein
VHTLFLTLEEILKLRKLHPVFAEDPAVSFLEEVLGEAGDMLVGDPRRSKRGRSKRGQSRVSQQILTR